MLDVYVVSAARTPIGTKDGLLGRVHPVTLGEVTAKEVAKRAGIPDEEVRKVIKECNFGCATQTGQQGFNIARLIAYRALGYEVPGSTENMLCGSSAQAIRNAFYRVGSGDEDTDVVIAGGVENNAMVRQGADLLPALSTQKGAIKNLKVVIGNAYKTIRRGEKVAFLSLPEGYILHPMGKSGDAIARKYNFSRKTLDEFALRSQNLATIAQRNGWFEKEIVPIQTKKGIISSDEGIRPDSTMTSLAKLRGAFGGDSTAGNSSQISVSAASVVLANENSIKKYSLSEPMARIVATAVVATDPKIPEEQLLGPINVIEKVLKKANLKLDDIDLFEINEAFASVVLATQRDLEIPMEKINVNGGAIALGHPLGASGARLPVTLLHEMERRASEGKPSKYGLAVLCIGAGQAIATIFERV